MLIEDDEILYVLKAPLAVGEVHIMHNPIAVLALVLSTSLLLRAISEDWYRRLLPRPISHLSPDPVLHPSTTLPAGFSKYYWFARRRDGLRPSFVCKLLPR